MQTICPYWTTIGITSMFSMLPKGSTNVWLPVPSMSQDWIETSGLASATILIGNEPGVASTVQDMGMRRKTAWQIFCGLELQNRQGWDFIMALSRGWHTTDGWNVAWQSRPIVRRRELQRSLLKWSRREGKGEAGGTDFLLSIQYTYFLFIHLSSFL